MIKPFNTDRVTSRDYNKIGDYWLQLDQMVILHTTINTFTELLFP